MGDADDQGRDGSTALVDEAKDRATAIADEATERAGALADEAQRRGAAAADAGREKAADGIEDAAAIVREQSDKVPGQIADKAAEHMERTAGYLREHDVSEIRSEVEHYVREHPLQGVAAAVAAGFLIGRALR